jgi:hypothetical protein
MRININSITRETPRLATRVTGVNRPHRETSVLLEKRVGVLLPLDLAGAYVIFKRTLREEIWNQEIYLPRLNTKVVMTAGLRALDEGFGMEHDRTDLILLARAPRITFVNNHQMIIHYLE